MKKCLICQKELQGRQTKYCSRRCKNKNSNYQHQNYQSQQKRGKDRKKKLIRLLGHKCKICGYNKNSAALDFHHKDPNEKVLKLDLRSCSNNKWEKLVKEASKCDLLCANCHRELHNPIELP
jgi:predicted HNH restriction endonuclease